MRADIFPLPELKTLTPTRPCTTTSITLPCAAPLPEPAAGSPHGLRGRQRRGSLFPFPSFWQARLLQTGGKNHQRGRLRRRRRPDAVPVRRFSVATTGCWSRRVGSSAVQPPWRACADGARRLWRTWGTRSVTVLAWWWLRRPASGPDGDVGCRPARRRRGCRAVRWLGAGLQSPAAELEAHASTVAAQPF